MADPFPRPKGPRVWLDLDQQALDDAYDQTVYARNAARLHQRRELASEATRQRLGQPQRLAYGPTAIEGLDLYRTAAPHAPVLVIIHGGAWRAGMARDFADSVEVFVRAGAHCAVLDFINVIDAGGSLFPMVEQVRRAIAFLARHAADFGGDGTRIHVFGRSSGAHLGGVAITSDWAREFGLPADVIKGVLLSSGMYDLKPVRLSKRGQYVRFTDEMEQALSPIRHLQRINCPVIVAYGTCETPEFQRQARDFAAALAAAGKQVELLVGVGYNHFELPETLANPYALLGRAMLTQMRLGPL
ncbi:MAG: alpha/beta hydrolase [Hyphomicrobiales bacterium]|nr:alpha/beta hydrolase [Hyphomicrobiales bacterium]